MLTEWNSAPAAFSACEVRLEKPHIGNCGVPFMNNTIGCAPSVSLMRSMTSIADLRWMRAHGSARKRIWYHRGARAIAAERPGAECGRRPDRLENPTHRQGASHGDRTSP